MLVATICELLHPAVDIGPKRRPTDRTRLATFRMRLPPIHGVNFEAELAHHRFFHAPPEARRGRRYHSFRRFNEFPRGLSKAMRTKTQYPERH